MMRRYEVEKEIGVRTLKVVANTLVYGTSRPAHLTNTSQLSVMQWWLSNPANAI
jgi:hypothetical protein